MATTSHSIPSDRMAVLFAVMLVAAAGNTAMQSILPLIGTKLRIPDVWVSLAFSWSALLWVLTAPYWARHSDKRGRKALMALGVVGFMSSMGLCGIVLWVGLEGLLGAGVTFIAFAAQIAGNADYAAHWAGQGAPLARALPAAQLMQVLAQELEQAQRGRH